MWKGHLFIYVHGIMKSGAFVGNDKIVRLGHWENAPQKRTLYIKAPYCKILVYNPGDILPRLTSI